MTQQSHGLSSAGMGLVQNWGELSVTDPASLKYEQTLPEFEKVKGLPSNGIFEIEEGFKFIVPYKDGTHTVQLQCILFCSHGIIDRGTIFVRVVCACTHCAPNHCDWSGKKFVLKLSFPSVTRVLEKAFMDCCKEQAKGRTTTSMETALECAQVFYDIVQCHHWIYTYPQILHRDINHGNVMVRVKDRSKYGVFNDWDLAMWLDKRDGILTSQFRTGTRPYMAHEQHSPDWEGLHRYRHDVESLFYVILLLATLFSNPREKNHEHSKKRQPYTQWFTQGHDFLHLNKISIIFVASWQPTPTHFFSAFHGWLKRLHDTMNDGFLASAAYVNRQNEQLRQISHFNDDTLDNHFSYDKFVLIMHQFGEEDLATHGSEWQGKLRGLQKDEDERKK
ncbi:hypothetical protein F5876DRAFT_70448 [Lentinula aff. lateritia]|uniref:Uncharacterized protein n=1 Tax=Lentinula aff. lateritia TaxID=2804960 RepID=A0ACC1TJI4_9AGAR|nr:hypothetical protein F5876DRAFT_70448 [Lentinula aff. lateritia]